LHFTAGYPSHTARRAGSGPSPSMPPCCPCFSGHFPASSCGGKSKPSA
jgi:hypothetical protein